MENRLAEGKVLVFKDIIKCSVRLLQSKDREIRDVDDWLPGLPITCHTPSPR